MQQNVFIKEVRKKKPLVHCITNYVTMNDCANVLLAVGASPVMAHHPAEVAEAAEGCDALLCNLGAMEDFEAMKIAVQAAMEQGHPIVLDPVGVGGIAYRRARCAELLNVCVPTCIRGNASEIKALYAGCQTTKGVDVSSGDCDAEAEIEEAVTGLSRRLGCIVVASGAVDLISDGNGICRIREGDEMMTRITGTGCMSSALIAAFVSCAPTVEAVAAACTMMGQCGKWAADRTRTERSGTMQFRMHLIDRISLMD